MRKQLEYLSYEAQRVDTDNLYEAIHNLVDIIRELILIIDQALPIAEDNADAPT